MIEIKEGLTFEDVMLVPQYSEVKSRSEIDVSVKIADAMFRHPIIPANMSSVMGKEMALAVINSGGLAILHRFLPIEEQFDIVKDIIANHRNYAYDRLTRRLAVSVGVKDEDIKNLDTFLGMGVQMFCIDIAHGDSAHCVNMIQEIRKRSKVATIIAGNVSTSSGARRLWTAGADVVKVGVGSGSLCTTRIETGNGVPQLTALMDVAKIRELLTAPMWHVASGDISGPNVTWERDLKASIERPLYIISDGGIKSAGDVVKALCFADMIMTGNLFASCVETPGEIHMIDGFPHKEYRGSSTHKTNHIEGVVAWMPCTGKYSNVLTKLLEGLRSGMSYQGVNTLSELKDSPAFIRITLAGLRESHPHAIIK